jgi:N-acylneuraminate cytidylyltransferase
MEALAVIPARGGSRRIPRKNVRLMSGRPLLAWAVDLCLESGLFAQTIVSTDDDEIAEIARAAGAHVPFRRPAELADDHASTVSVISHAVTWYAAEHGPLDAACCVYPAAILVSAQDLSGGRDLLDRTDRPYVASVTEYPYPVQRALERDDEGRLSFVDPAAADMRTQDLAPRWHDAGQFYWGRWPAWAEGLAILPHAAGYPLPPGSVVDIDTEADWDRAAGLHALRRD